jgi:predicted acyl esterase
LVPVTTRGGNVCCTGLETEAGGYDQSTVEMRNDALVYSSAPLDQGIEVTGFLEVVLYVSSDAKVDQSRALLRATTRFSGGFPFASDCSARGSQPSQSWTGWC